LLGAPRPSASIGCPRADSQRTRDAVALTRALTRWSGSKASSLATAVPQTGSVATPDRLSLTAAPMVTASVGVLRAPVRPVDLDRYPSSRLASRPGQAQ